MNAPSPSRRVLHPVAWWSWAVGLAVCAFRTTNPLLLVLVAAVAIFVAMTCRTDAPWSRSIGTFIRLGLFVIVFRVVLQMIFGNRLPGHVLFTLPSVPLPSWAAGVSIGGPVTAESLVGALIVGLRLAVILICFGAANTLASPYRLLRCLPAVLYETGVAITVSLAFAPELVATISEVRRARRLRGRPIRGVAGLRGMAIPVLEGALDRSLQLASAMDARGFGRRRAVGDGVRRGSNLALAGGLLCIVGGLYGVLVSGSLPVAGLPLLVVGVSAVAVALLISGRRSERTRYRPDVWAGPEWVVVVSTLVAVGGLLVAGALGVAGLAYAASPLTFPSLPLLPACSILAAIAPVFVDPVFRRTTAAASALEAAA